MEEQKELTINSLAPFCSGYYQVAFICQTEGCSQQALMCDNDLCECSKKHDKCTSKITLKEFLTQIQSRKRQVPANIKTIFEDIIKHYDQMIEKLSESKIQFLQFTNMFGLSQNMIKTVNALTEGRQEHITGNFANKIFMKSKTEQIPYTPEAMTYQKQLGQLKQQIKFLFDFLPFQLISQQKKNKIVFQTFSKNNQNQTKMEIKGKSYMADSHWQVIPIQISYFTHLKSLGLHQTIKNIGNLDNLTQLQWLNLKHNGLTQIKGLSKLINLTTLNLCENKIQNIQNLDKLVNLQYLYFDHNKIRQIKGLQKLTNLIQLNLNYNQITQIKGLDNQINLLYLFLQSNEITELKGLDNLQNLSQLSLTQNKISKLQNVNHLQNLKKLTLYRNPLVQIKEQKIKIDEFSNKVKVQAKNLFDHLYK